MFGIIIILHIYMSIMDSIDQKLIARLRHNGRESVSNLAEHLGVTRATVNARLARLEKDGVIQGYTVRLGENHPERPIRGITMIKVEGQMTEQVKKRILALPDIECVHHTNGQWDMIAEISAPDMAHFDTLLSAIRDIGSISHSETHLLLSTHRFMR